jgi:molybdenum cofactor biosynthesis enzyme MoaA
MKCGNFGFSLPRGSLINYMRIRMGHLNETIGENGSSFPLVSIMAAMRCNLKCSFCICGNFPGNWKDYEMTVPIMSHILTLNAVKKSLMIVFTGGEPTLNKNLPELMHMTRKEKHLIGMISNGTLLENGLPEELASAGLCDAQISIYENTKERLSKTFPKISNLFSINASYVLLKSKLYDSQKNNFKDLIEMIKMCQETGCSSIKINLYQSQDIHNSQNPNNTELIFLNDPVYVQFIEQCKLHLRNINFTGYLCKASILTSRFTVFFPSPYTPIQPAMIEENPERHCRLPWTLGTFNAQGNYGFCCGTSIEPEINNVFTHGEKIINSDKACRIRKCLIDPKEPLAPECAKCVYLSGSYISDL